VEAKALDPAKIGLKNPPFTISVWTREGGKPAAAGKPEVLYLGDDTPDGNALYARLQGRRDILVLSSYVRSQFNKTADDLRDKKPFHFTTPEEVVALGLRRGTEIIALRRGKAKGQAAGTWTISAPIKTEADSPSVDELVRALQGLNLAKFVEEKPKDFGVFGLTSPRLVVSAKWRKKGERRAHTDILLIGGPYESDQCYVRVQGQQAIAALKNEDLSKFDKSLFDLRDKKVVRFDRASLDRVVVRKGDKSTTLAKKGKDWLLQPGDKPTQAGKAEDLLWDLEDLRAQQFVEEQVKDLAKYGLDKPALEVTLAAGGEEKGLLAAPVPSAAQYYVKSKAAGFVAIVDAGTLDRISADPATYERKEPKTEKKPQDKEAGKK